MLIKYTKNGWTRVAEMNPDIEPDSIAKTLEIPSDAWEQITPYEADLMRVKAEISIQLTRLDISCVRALRAKELGAATDEDEQKLKEVESLAVELREELQLL